MFDLKGKVALVTGAKRGMGRSHALMLASQGATIVVTDVDSTKKGCDEECHSIISEIYKNGGEAACFTMDVTDSEAIHKVVAQVVKMFGRLDILVNNAGIYSPKPALEITEEEWDKTLAVNLKGQFLCAQAAAQEMAKNKWGRIINISSIASGQVGIGIAGGAHYTASKGGVIAMSQTLAIELAPLGITVNVVAPGAIDTPMAHAADMSKEQLDGFLQRIPLKRMGKPEDVSPLVVFLASEESRYVTGSTFYVDGGWIAS